MIVVDGRTDEEKLLELLATGAEDTALDFKATLDLSGRATKDSVEFAKDAISMGNLPFGGYIVVGVDDTGTAAHDQAVIAVDQFDSAKLRAKVAKYVESPIHIVSQHHVVDGRAVVVVYVAPNPDGLPVPISSIGQYAKNNGQMETAFSEGEVLIREGTSNVRLRYAHWNQLLDQYRERIKLEARRDADDLIHRVVEGFRGGAQSSRPIVSLDPGMDDETLVEALTVLFESGSLIRVQQFLNDAALRAGGGDPSQRDRRLDALHQVTVIACQAVMYRRDDTFRLAVATLERAYRARLQNANSAGSVDTDEERAQHYLDVLIHLMAIGSLVVRREAWGLLPDLANRQVTETGSSRSSWLRHALTMAARANLLQGSQGGNRGGQVLSLARTLVSDKPSLRPDYGASPTLPGVEELSHADWLLNSLCEFDLWWCVIAVAFRNGEDHLSAAYYPSCAGFRQWRAQPTLKHIATEPKVRAGVFGELSDELIASSMRTVVEMAVGQSHQYGTWWDGFGVDAVVDKYVETYATATT